MAMMEVREKQDEQNKLQRMKSIERTTITILTPQTRFIFRNFQEAPGNAS